MAYLCIFFIGMAIQKLLSNVITSHKSKTTTWWRGSFICQSGKINEEFWVSITKFMKDNFIENDKVVIHIEKEKK